MHSTLATELTTLRQRIREHYLADESQAVTALVAQAALESDVRQTISQQAASLVTRIREETTPSMMESFLAEYGLSTREGIALMCLAEALLRVPDEHTIDALIEDKIVPGAWSGHRGHSTSSLVNASTWALLMTGKLLAPPEQAGLLQTLQGMVKRLGEPVVRTAVAQAMKELGRQFVLGRTISEATQRARKQEAMGYTYSYDMLGEAARTADDAQRYFDAYADAINTLSAAATHDDIRQNPGISVKLSALHPRYEFAKSERVMVELVPRVAALAEQAKVANMGFNIDAEEADRLDLSLDVIEAVLANDALAGWDGFGVVVQAFGQRARPVLDWLYALATRLDRRIMVRLVKGAYWDAEIKRAQVLGLSGFPVFTSKVHTDVSYLSCATQLLTMTDRIYPQFATHNAHSVAAIVHLAQGRESEYEFQRLHGMGESLHDTVLTSSGTRCRIYAPVGAHQDLLAYLVRRLLENGANSSFVNQIVDTDIAPETVAQDPFELLSSTASKPSHAIAHPEALFGEHRRNAKGWDITDLTTMQQIDQQRTPFKHHQWQAKPMIAGHHASAASQPVYNPADPDDVVGHVVMAQPDDIEHALVAAQQGFTAWSQCSAQARAECLRRLADLYEQHAAELFALTCREAGKIMLDAVGEVREAVDFARYYADEAERCAAEGEARGVIVCISPWNFPLAIFSGQVLAALAAGNAVIAKPAEQTPLIAARAVSLMHEAGIPQDALQLVPGDGRSIGAALVSDARVSGVAFTGSTATAQHINRAMAAHLSPHAPLIAETGGLNAMIVDSTALPEQAVRDILASAFQSAGQRCSALRVLYVQEDIADNLLTMLYGAMDELALGDPWQLATDIGPVIDEAAQTKIEQHCNGFAAQGAVEKRLAVPQTGRFVAPTVIRVAGIEALQEEIFGPVLHVATFKAEEIDRVIDAINSKGFGLTFGLHTRVDSRVNRIVERVDVGNVYVNRNQIGAVVGSQPFGGEGLSGTGPKAGGPHYVKRLMQTSTEDNAAAEGEAVAAPSVDESLLTHALHTLTALPTLDEPLVVLREVFDPALVQRATLMAEQILPGPTGETNRMTLHPRGSILCLGPNDADLQKQVCFALAQGNRVVVIATTLPSWVDTIVAAGLPVTVCEGVLAADALQQVPVLDAIASFADDETCAAYRCMLAQRPGMLVPLITERNAPERYVLERHLCVDTTAAGGNASLIAGQG